MHGFWALIIIALVIGLGLSLITGGHQADTTQPLFPIVQPQSVATSQLQASPDAQATTQLQNTTQSTNDTIGQIKAVMADINKAGNLIYPANPLLGILIVIGIFIVVLKKVF